MSTIDVVLCCIGSGLLGAFVAWLITNETLTGVIRKMTPLSSVQKEELARYERIPQSARQALKRVAKNPISGLRICVSIDYSCGVWLLNRLVEYGAIRCQKGNHDLEIWCSSGCNDTAEVTIMDRDKNTLLCCRTSLDQNSVHNNIVCELARVLSVDQSNRIVMQKSVQKALA